MTKKVSILFLVLLFPLLLVAGDISGVPVIDQDYYERALGVNNICGPTVASEVIAYWGQTFPDLLAGDLDGTFPETSPAMNALLSDMLDYSNWNIYRGTPPTDLVAGIREYMADYGVEAEVFSSGKGRASWSAVVNEIDNGRPVILLLWDMSHYVVITGYSQSGYTRRIKVLFGHHPLETVINATYLSASSLETIFVRPLGAIEPPPEEADPSTEPWYEAVMAWCAENGWELRPRD